MSAPVDGVVNLGSGDRVAIRRWGHGGHPLLLIHGFMGGREAWSELPERLGDEYEVVAVDLPGHGNSAGVADPARYEVSRVARDLAQVQQLTFHRPATWLGYSMGGRIALAAAMEGIPMRALLLESSSPGLQDPEAREARLKRDEGLARRIEELGLTGFVEEWLSLPLFQGIGSLPPPIRAAARNLRVSHDPRYMAAWLRGGGTGAQKSYWEGLPGLEIPVHILVGERDKKFTEIGRWMDEALPRSTLTVAAEVGHTIHLEDPRAWTQWVRAAHSDLST